MKLSVLPVSYFRQIIDGEMTVGEWAREGSALSLDAIDISILFLKKRDPEYLHAMRNEIASAGMHVAVVSTYPDFTHPDPDERKKQISDFRSDVEALAAIGAEMIRITAGQAHPGTNRDLGITWAVDGIKQSIDCAEKHGIQLLYENHSKPGAWQYADFSHPTDIFLEIADALHDSPVKILFDTANPIAYGDDPVPLLEQVIDRVLCIHAADTRTWGSLDPVIVGKGIVPFDKIFSLLKGEGYSGWVSIEEASGQGKAGVQEAVSFVRKAWSETVPRN